MDPELYIFKITKKEGFWPISSRYEGYTEVDLFNVIKVLYDLVATPRGNDGFNVIDAIDGTHIVLTRKQETDKACVMFMHIQQYGSNWEGASGFMKKLNYKFSSEQQVIPSDARGVSN